MAFEKKTQGIDPSKLNEFLSGAKDVVSMQPETKTLDPLRHDPAAPNLSFADLIPLEEKTKKFPLLLPPALHRELTKLAQKEVGGLHGFILRTLAEKVMYEKTGDR